MPYTDIQCIGMDADVGGAQALYFNNATGKSGPKTPGEAFSPAQKWIYQGLSNDELDIKTKVERLKNNANLAFNHADNHATTLKIFMAPEFYFRGSKGAYDLESIPLVLEEVRKAFGDAQWKDWLIIPGSAIGQLPIEGVDNKYLPLLKVNPEKNAKRIIEEEGGYEIFNVCFYQKGGFKEADGIHEGLVYKEAISHVDFLRTEHDKGTWQNKLYDRKAAINGEEARVYATEGSRDLGGKFNYATDKINEEKQNLGGGTIFTLDGIRFGLEVCLDHLRQRLRQVVAPDVPNLNVKTSKPVQVQLIPSAGMRINNRSIATVKNGIIFNVDGTQRHHANPTNNIDGYPCVLKQASDHFEQTWNAPPLASFYPLYDLQGPMWNDRVSVFPVRSLPAA